MTISVMKLGRNKWKIILKWVASGIFLVLFLIFFIKVLVFEKNYYTEKEGSERVIAVSESEDSLSEIEPTDEEKKEYQVEAGSPRYLTIEKLGIFNARIIDVGVTKDGRMGTPNNIFDVGWYNGSNKPGKGGTMVIDGHNGGPNIQGVFKELPNLGDGDIIQVERGDGKMFNYQVVENKKVSLDDSDKYMHTAVKSPQSGKESVTLISCTGEWSTERQTYLSRQFVRAILVE